MAVPVDVLGELSITGEGGEELRVEGRGNTISVHLPSVWVGRSLARQAIGRAERQGAVDKLQAGLRRADLTLNVTVAETPVAYLSPSSEETLLSKLLGIGSVEIKPLGLLRAMLHR